jgi:hypothetical protein
MQSKSYIVIDQLWELGAEDQKVVEFIHKLFDVLFEELEGISKSNQSVAINSRVPVTCTKSVVVCCC